jgi:hypothetical protein
MIHNKRLYTNRRYRNSTDIVPSATQDVIPKPTSGTAINETDNSSSSSIWDTLDKFLGTADKSADVWWKWKTGENVVYDSSGSRISIGRDDPNYGLFGMPKPWGAVILIGFVGIVGIAIYKLSK